MILLSSLITIISYKEHSTEPLFALSVVLTFLLIFDSLDGFFNFIANIKSKKKFKAEEKWWLNW